MKAHAYYTHNLLRKLTTEPSNSCIDCKALKKSKLVKYLKRFMYRRDPCTSHSEQQLCIIYYIKHLIDYKYPVRVFCITGVVVIGLLTV